MLRSTITDPELVRLLMAGGVGVLLTDTLYGVVCRANDPRAVASLYRAKHRVGKPGTVIAASIEQLVSFGLDKTSLRGAAAYWPGPFSVLIPVGAQHARLAQGKPELACRVIAGPVELLDVLSITGPLMTTSANLPGQLPARNIVEAEAYFGDSVDFYIDSGDISGMQPSTLIRMTDIGPEILRLGAATIDVKRGEEINDN